MIRYRIGILNDFDNTHSFVDYRDWGTLKTWDASRSGSAHRGYQLANDSIGIFLNFDLVLNTTSKPEARALIARLVADAPADLSDLEEYLTI